MLRRTLLIAVLTWGPSPWAVADGLSALSQFLAKVHSGDLGFTQTIVAPAGAAAPPPRVLQGRLRFARPDRFRFDYLKPYEQIIVADGKAIWLVDVDLQQVTVSDQQRTLAGSPVGLLLVARDRSALQRWYELSDGGQRGGLQWVSARPKQKDEALVEAQLGFDAAALVQMETVDAFGQRSTFRFDQRGLGQAVADAVFRFAPAPSLDVIDQRQR